MSKGVAALRLTLALAAGLLFCSRQSSAQPAETSPAAGHAEAANGEPGAPAQAEPTSEEAMKEASQRFQRGLELYRDGDYALALIEFNRAYELVPNYRVLYNIGQVSIQLTRYARARRALEQYLAEGGAEVPDARRTEVLADIEMLKRRTAFVSIETNQPGAEILIDEIPVGESPLGEPLLVDAGEHKVSVRKPGFRSRPARVILAGGDSTTLKVELTKEEARSPKIVVERRVESRIIEKNQAAARRNWLIAGWTTTGVLATGAVVAGALGASGVKDLQHALQTETTSEELKDKQDKARTLLAVADGLTVGALAIGGMSLYATLQRPNKKKSQKNGPERLTPAAGSRAQPKTTLSLGLGPRSVVLVGSF